MKTVDAEEQRGGPERGKGLEGIMAKTGCYPGMAGMGVARRGAGGRGRRILGRKGQVAHCYHLMSRTCAGSVLFDELEKEALVRLIRKLSQFSGIELLTYCVMGNHFHLLVRVPDCESWMAQFEGSDGEERLLSHLARFYSAGFMAELRWQLGEDRGLGDEASAQARMGGARSDF